MHERPAKNEDLHGFVPDTSRVALLLIDVINRLDFQTGHHLLEHALPMAAQISRLKDKAKAQGIPVIYINDNYGRWKSDFRQIVQICMHQDALGSRMSRLLQPAEDDYSVIKPKHSGFFSTTLDTLLAYLKVERLILTGVQTDICVLFTANDAYMRDFYLHVPSDCVASEQRQNSEYALQMMERILAADTTRSDQLDLAAMVGKPGQHQQRSSTCVP